MDFLPRVQRAGWWQARCLPRSPRGRREPCPCIPAPLPLPNKLFFYDQYCWSATLWLQSGSGSDLYFDADPDFDPAPTVYEYEYVISKELDHFKVAKINTDSYLKKVGTHWISPNFSSCLLCLITQIGQWKKGEGHLDLSAYCPTVGIEVAIGRTAFLWKIFVL